MSQAMNSETDDRATAHSMFSHCSGGTGTGSGGDGPRYHSPACNKAFEALATARAQGHRAGMETAAKLADGKAAVADNLAAHADIRAGQAYSSQAREFRDLATAILAAAEDTP